MSDGYAFWCSNCQISHAGECPPKKQAVAVLQALNDVGATLVPKVSYVPPPTATSYPRVGSEWLVEDGDLNGNWSLRSGSFRYKIIGWNTVTREVQIAHVPGGYQSLVNRDAWDPNGIQLTTAGDRYRFVLAP